MIWALVGVAALGLILGLCFCAPALIAATAGVASATLLVALLSGWQMWATSLAVLALVVTVQFSFFAGAWLAPLRLRREARRS